MTKTDNFTSRENLGLQVAGLRILEVRAQLGIATGTLYPRQQNADISAAAVGVSGNSANTSAGDLNYNTLAAFPASRQLPLVHGS